MYLFGVRSQQARIADLERAARAVIDAWDAADSVAGSRAIANLAVVLEEGEPDHV